MVTSGPGHPDLATSSVDRGERQKNISATWLWRVFFRKYLLNVYCLPNTEPCCCCNEMLFLQAGPLPASCPLLSFSPNRQQTFFTETFNRPSHRQVSVVELRKPTPLSHVSHTGHQSLLRSAPLSLFTVSNANILRQLPFVLVPQERDCQFARKG